MNLSLLIYSILYKMTKEEISKTNDIKKNLIQSNKIVILIIVDCKDKRSKSKNKVNSINKKCKPNKNKMILKKNNEKNEIKQTDKFNTI